MDTEHDRQSTFGLWRTPKPLTPLLYVGSIFLGNSRVKFRCLEEALVTFSLVIANAGTHSSRILMRPSPWYIAAWVNSKNSAAPQTWSLSR